jgi:hypothetical protein
MSVDLEMVAYPNSVVLSTRRWAIVAILILSVGLATLGWLLRDDDRWWSWPLTVFFATLAVFVTVQFFNPGALEVSPEGLRSSALGSKWGWSYGWSELNEFEVMDLMGNEVVRLSRATSNVPGTLASSYGHRYEELVAFFNRYREAALRG